MDENAQLICDLFASDACVRAHIHKRPLPRAKVTRDNDDLSIAHAIPNTEGFEDLRDLQRPRVLLEDFALFLL